MNRFREDNGALIWSKNHETVLIQPWGKDSLRVRSTIPLKCRYILGST